MAQSIMATYPGFYALPAGVKKMLLESESYFFAEASGRKPRPVHRDITAEGEAGWYGEPLMIGDHPHWARPWPH